MDINTLIQGFGSIGMFSSRAFLPAFITAFSLRYGAALPLLQNIDMIKHVGNDPTWFTHGGTITFLGIMSVLEITADKLPEARMAFQEVEKYSKSALAALSYLGIASVVDVQFIEKNISQAGFLDMFPTLLIAGATFAATALRKNLLETLQSADEDDDLGIQNLISWAEDIWAAFGIFALLLFPVFMLLLNGAVLGVLFLAQKYVHYREEKSKVECGQCKEPVYRSAMACPKCGTKRDNPAKIGFLGQSKKEPESDLVEHPYLLAMKKRCPVCATRFKKRAVRQTCQACGHELMEDKTFARHYLQQIRLRVPTVCLIGFLFSLVPVIGLIPGVIYYRLKLVAPFRQYIPLTRRFLLKLLISILFFLLIGLQWIPGIGGFVIPAMALISYSVYGTQFRSLAGL